MVGKIEIVIFWVMAPNSCMGVYYQRLYETAAFIKLCGVITHNIPNLIQYRMFVVTNLHKGQV